jgi:CelD/BcsL family acetyltransferase involved in cellulose biosynthesis
LEKVAALRPDYERLGRVTGNRLPFALHDWHMTWCSHFLNCDPRIRDEPLFYVLRNEVGSCVAILPFILTRRRVGPFKVAYVNPLGEDPSVTEIRTPMIEAGYESTAVRTVQAALEKAPDWDWVHWMHLGSELKDALGSSPHALHWRPPLANVVLDLAPTWGEFRAGLKRNIRESLRHCYNSLKREALALEFDVLEQPAEVRRGLDRYLELHRMRAAFRCGPAHPDRFETNASRTFLRAVCDRLAAHNAVRLFALRISGEYIAMRLAFVVADSLYFYYSGFDPAWWRYGVMTTTDAESIKYAIQHGFKTINLSPTNVVSKRRWGPREVGYPSAYQVRSSLLSRLANGVYSDDSKLGKLLRRWAGPRSWN